MTGGDDAGIESGFVDAELAAELPGIGLRWACVERGSGRSTAGLQHRLAYLSDRFTGAYAIELRRRPIPWAYRVFFRHIGLDPDEQLTPVEALSLERLRKGGFLSNNILDDALTVAIMESGVALQAFDGDRVEPPLGIRPSAAGETLGEGPPLTPGTLVIADANGPVGTLFGPFGPGRGVSQKTQRMVVVAIQVAGVPDIAVEEALWLLLEALAEES